MLKKLYAIAIFSLLLTGSSYAQVVNVTIPASPSGQFFINDLNNISLINTKPSILIGYMVVAIQDKNLSTVFTIQSPVTQLQPGFTSLASSKLLLSGTMTYGDNSAAVLLKTTGQLPPGQYVFCATFYSTSKQVLGLNCQETQIQLLYPPRLTYPQNGQNIKDLLPVLSWTAPGPLSDPNVTYHLRLVEVMSGQSTQLAFSINNALIDGDYANLNALQYPVNAQPLVYGQTYAWQVSASDQGYNLGITQLWTFTPSQVKNLVEYPTPDSTSYPIVAKQLTGGFYVAKNILRFAYTNRTDDSLLSYTIYDVASSDTVQYKTTMPLLYGMNRVRMPIGSSNLFTNGEFYLLDIEDANEIHYYLSFVYVSPSTE